MPEPELEALQRSLDGLNESLGHQNQLIREQNAKLDTQAQDLKDIQELLPSFVHRGRFNAAIGGLLVAGVAVLAFVLWSRADNRAEAARERDRLALVAIGRAYGNCEAVNRAFHGVDLGYTAVFEFLHSMEDPRDASAHQRIDRLHEEIRRGLLRTDCSVHLRGLSPSHVQQVVGAPLANPPLLPLPPPPAN